MEPSGVRRRDDARPPAVKETRLQPGPWSRGLWRGQRQGGSLDRQLQMESRSLSAGLGRAEPPSDGCAGTRLGEGGCPP